MAIQVPRLERVSVQAPTPEARVPNAVPNIVGASQPQAQAASNLAETAFKLIDQAEDDKINTDTLAIVQKWRTDRRNELTGPEGIKYKDGDPTPYYEEFEKKRIETYDSVLAEHEGASEKFKKALASRLGTANFEIQDSRNTQYGHQYAVYKENVTNSSVQLAKDDMIEASTQLVAKGSTGAIDMQIDKIKQYRYDAGVGDGTVIKDETGKIVKVEPSVQIQIAKDLSDSLSFTVSNLNASKRPDLAKVMLDKYGEYIAGDKMDNLTKQTNDAALEKDAFSVLNEAIGKSGWLEAKEYIRTSTKGQPELQKKAFDLYTSQKREMEYIEKQSSDDAYEQLAGYVFDKMNGGAPFVDTTQLKQDSQYKTYINMIKDPNQKEAILEMVERPKESNPTSWERSMSALTKNEFYGMKPADFQKLTVGLNKEDFNYFRSAYGRANEQTASELRTRDGEAQRHLWKLVTSDQYIRTDAYNPNIPDDRDREELMAIQKGLGERLKYMPPNLIQPSDINQYVENYVLEYKGKKPKISNWQKITTMFNKTFNTEDKPKVSTPVETAPETPPSTSTPNSNAPIFATREDFLKNVEAFKKKYPNRRPSKYDLEQFAKENR